MRRMLRLMPLLMAALLALAAQASPMRPKSDLPRWLQAKVDRYAVLPPEQSAQAVWQISVQGRPAYLEIAPCCDQLNPLFDSQGHLLCHPSGGLTGIGDGRCPHPADRNRAPQLLWVHPHVHAGQLVPPQLSAP
ncbi:MAG TPA: hypothetical protein VFM33_01360 [Aquabacterium sp.]|nr:hypothetical protein [Aquabacterium sp.]